MSETKNFNGNVNTNIENGKGAQMSENIKKLVEKYKALNALPINERGKTIAIVSKAAIREDDPMLWRGDEWCICITAEGLLYGYDSSPWSEAIYIHLSPDEDIPSDVAQAMEQVGFWEFPTEDGLIPERFTPYGNVSDHLYGCDWDDLFDCVSSGAITPDDIPHEAWAIDGGDDTYGFHHAIRRAVYYDDKLDLESERDEYASDLVVDIVNGELTAKGLDDAGWYGAEDAKAILDACKRYVAENEDETVPDWLLEWCEEQMQEQEQDKEETAND